MRILCLTNFYPPCEIGGEEQSCYDMVVALKARGHAVAVLTSNHGCRRGQVEDGVYRRLYLEMELGSPLHPLRFFLSRKRREEQSLAQLRQTVQEFVPDVIFIWGMWNLPRSLPALAEALRPGRVLYRFGDYWPTLPSQHVFYWRIPGRRWFTRPLKRALSRLALARLSREEPAPALRFQHAYCISAAMRDKLVEQGVPVEHARIIYNGVDTNRFRPGSGVDSRRSGNSRVSLLYAGRVVPEKGVHTAVEAVAHLVQRGVKDVALTILGPRDPDYEATLRQLVAGQGLESYVSFRDPVSKEAMPGLLPHFDVLIFPSIWPEPFGRILIEAMACGLAVVCTPVGGVPEVVTDEQDGLFFAPEDANGLASQIERLLRDPLLLHRLAQAARCTVEQRFSLSRMVDQVETYLQEIASAPQAQPVASMGVSAR